MNIDILLGAYQGEPYLRQQVESLLAQTVSGWRLLVRDDGSRDGTVAIIREYERRYSGQVVEVDAGGGNLGVVGNFARLMAASNADYVMFCDQDDIWYPDKIETTLQAMRQMEDRYGMTVPLLVHTDARLVDNGLKPTHPSFHRALSHRPERSSLAGELVQNTAHGCTIMMNRPLVKLALPVPQEARMHDMWAHLLALAVGHTHYLDMPTLDYRQHGGNAIGAVVKTGSLSEARRKARRSMECSVRQAEKLLERVGRIASPCVLDDIRCFISAANQPWPAGTWALLTRYCPPPVLKNAVRLLLR